MRMPADFLNIDKAAATDRQAFHAPHQHGVPQMSSNGVICQDASLAADQTYRPQVGSSTPGVILLLAICFNTPLSAQVLHS